jgi:alpha-beta hydrolase superfamily lysophospholipase
MKKILAAVIILTVLTIHTTAMKPEHEYKARPSDYGIIYREITIQTKDNLSIKAWFYPAQDTNGIGNDIVGRYVPVPTELKYKERPYSLLDNQRRPTIVVCMGDAGNMTYLILTAYHLCIRGFNVLTFDWRGFGESSDWPIDKDQLSCTEFLVDYDAALDYIKTQPEVDTTRIGVFGYSTGAYLSFAAAAKRNEIAAFGGRALMTSFKDLLAAIELLDTSRHFKAPPGYPSGLEPENAAGKINIPVFLIVGEKDVRTPVWMSKKVYDKISSPKELWIVPGAEHGGMKGPELYNYPEFYIRVVDFFNKYLIN